MVILLRAKGSLYNTSLLRVKTVDWLPFVTLVSTLLTGYASRFSPQTSDAMRLNPNQYMSKESGDILEVGIVEHMRLDLHPSMLIFSLLYREAQE